MSLMSVYESMRARFVEAPAEREDDARRMAEIQQKLVEMEVRLPHCPALRSLVSGHIAEDRSFAAREPHVREIIETLDRLESLAEQRDWWVPEPERHARVVEECCVSGDRELAGELRQIVSRYADLTVARTRADLLAAAAEYLWEPFDDICEESVLFWEAATRTYLKLGDEARARALMASLVVSFHCMAMFHAPYYFASIQTALIATPVYAAAGDREKLRSCLTYIPDNLASARGECDAISLAEWVERSREALSGWTGHDLSPDFWEDASFTENTLASLMDAIMQRFRPAQGLCDR